MLISSPSSSNSGPKKYDSSPQRLTHANFQGGEEHYYSNLEDGYKGRHHADKNFKSFEGWSNAITKEGIAFENTYRRDDASMFTIELPMTIFSSILAAGISINNMPWRELICMFLMLSGPLFIGAVMSTIAQATFVIYLSLIVTGAEEAESLSNLENSCSSHWFLKVVAAAVFVACVLVNVYESDQFISWIRFSPRLEKNEINQLTKDNISSLAMTETAILKNGRRIFKYPRWVQGTGLSKLTKWISIAVLVLPKIAVEISLCIYGVPYIVYARSVEDVILNSLALLFVLDIDDVAYKLLTTTTTRHLMESLPPVLALMPDTYEEWSAA